MKTYNGGILHGVWEAYIKVDGVNLRCEGTDAWTRDDNHYTLPFPLHGTYELFQEDWGKSISLLANLSDAKPSSFYLLSGRDERLFLSYLNNPNEDTINDLLSFVVARGHEGLVLKKGKEELKVKAFVTPDVRVTGIKWGTGRNEGRVGSLITAYGNVLLQKDEDKESMKDGSIIGKIVEVKCMGWTEKGKMRQARYLRTREDKDTENLERIEDKYGNTNGE